MKLVLFEQSAFGVESKGETIVVDPGSYCSEASLKTIIGLQPQAVLVTHIHPDHFSMENLLKLRLPVYTVPQVAAEIFKSSSELEVTIIKEGDDFEIRDTPFTAVATASDHGPIVPKLLDNVGFWLSDGEKSLYYLGDMAVVTPPPSQPYDVVLIPVGNRGYTFGPEEAAEHSKALLSTALYIPIHYQGSGSEVYAQPFCELVAESLHTKILEIGESLEIK